jgi:hypothetical protein
VRDLRPPGLTSWAAIGMNEPGLGALAIGSHASTVVVLSWFQSNCALSWFRTTWTRCVWQPWNSSIRIKAATKRLFKIPARIQSETRKGSILSIAGPILGIAHRCIPRGTDGGKAK